MKARRFSGSSSVTLETSAAPIRGDAFPEEGLSRLALRRSGPLPHVQYEHACRSKGLGESGKHGLAILFLNEVVEDAAAEDRIESMVGNILMSPIAKDTETRSPSLAPLATSISSGDRSIP